MSVFQSLKSVLQLHPSDVALRIPDEINAPAGVEPLSLQRLTLEDQVEWNDVRWRNSEWLKPWESGDPMQGPSMSFAQWVHKEKQSEEAGNGVVFLMKYRGQIVGQLSIGAITYGSMRTATLGYWIDERWAGHGFTPLAVAMASDWAILDPQGPQLHRIEIAILPENQRSKRVVEKLRLRYEGLRTKYMFINGVWRDHEVYVLMPEDIQEPLIQRLQS
ncbi:MAG: GNAT family N-acetyltransferase [Bifidobacterium sp.]|jgi:ribosomal-protein-alanine N-acetyltransferase|nr:GNAT family N-acetyltransferase [Bifidobacterium sp.]